MNNRGGEEENGRDEDESPIRHAASRYISGPGWRRRHRKKPHLSEKEDGSRKREGRPVCEEAISPSSVGDSNPLLVWDLGV